MSKEVKRFYIMPGSVPALLSGDPAYTPMTNHLTDVHTVPLVLASDYDALLAERDALAKDAERYRWLRQRLVGASFDWDDEGMTVLAFEMPDGVSIGADCDKNIDAAMQGAQP